MLCSDLDKHQQHHILLWPFSGIRAASPFAFPFWRELHPSMACLRVLAAASLLCALGAGHEDHDHCTHEASMVNYTCNTTTCGGYMAYKASACTASMKCPAVVIIQDWNGMNDYEKERTRMLAEMGYVGLRSRHLRLRHAC